MSMPMRIWIVGTCGSGKSTLAEQLGERLGLPVTHMDEVYWNPGWSPTPDAEVYRRLDEVTAGDRWVIDGNYSRFREPFHDRIDLAVWLDLPLSVTFPRLLRRGWQRVVGRELICNGNRESIVQTLFTKDSLLWWALHTHHRRRAQLARQLQTLRASVRLRSPRAVREWLAGVSNGFDLLD